MQHLQKEAVLPIYQIFCKVPIVKWLRLSLTYVRVLELLKTKKPQTKPTKQKAPKHMLKIPH